MDKPPAADDDRPVRVLSLNAGSSSLKFAVWDVDTDERRLTAGVVDGIGQGTASLVLDGTTAVVTARDVAAAVPIVLEALRGPAPDAVGHRVVHGGAAHVGPQRIDGALRAALEALVPFAPLHQPAALAGIDAVAAQFPHVPQVACFDTAFHRRMPAVAQRLPLPRALWDAGVRRYGFHGLSYEWVVHALGDAARGRLVIAHLGNGCSLAAVRDGVSVDTTMGFTPTGGVMMGTRTGDLDPGVLVHLLRTQGLDAAALERLVDRESGLLGVSGATADMRRLLASTDVAAREAVELFCWIARRHVGALATTLGGLDALVFTGGIGEHAAPVRAGICAGLEHLGVVVDESANARHAPIVSTADSRCVVRVVPTDEDRMIARHTRAVLG